MRKPRVTTRFECDRIPMTAETVDGAHKLIKAACHYSRKNRARVEIWAWVQHEMGEALRVRVLGTDTRGVAETYEAPEALAWKRV